MKKSNLIKLLIPIILVAIIWLSIYFIPVVTEKNGAVYYLKPSTSVATMMSELSEQQIISHPYIFAFYAYLHGKSQLKTGEYLFHQGSTYASIWKQVTHGIGFVNYPFTIVPGWTFNQLHDALLKAPKIHNTSAQMSDKQIMFRVGSYDQDPEGEFYPETYYYTRDMSDLVILKRAYDLMQTVLNDEWETREPNLPYKNPYEALIAASLIEKEGYYDSERPVIAGVLVNRIRKNMLIQFDPTVIYGLGLRYDGTIHKKDLLENTPYNTYVHKGLPPTPIAMPGRVSIHAALHPINHDYLYFVARKDKSHQFSKTLAEHHTAVTTMSKQK